MFLNSYCLLVQGSDLLSRCVPSCCWHLGPLFCSLLPSFPSSSSFQPVPPPVPCLSARVIHSLYSAPNPTTETITLDSYENGVLSMVKTTVTPPRDWMRKISEVQKDWEMCPDTSKMEPKSLQCSFSIFSAFLKTGLEIWLGQEAFPSKSDKFFHFLAVFVQQLSFPITFTENKDISKRSRKKYICRCFAGLLNKMLWNKAAAQSGHLWESGLWRCRSPQMHCHCVSTRQGPTWTAAESLWLHRPQTPEH